MALITIFGGSGFVGRAIVNQAARAGYQVRIATRNPTACYELRALGTPGQVVPQYYDPSRPESMAAAVAGSAAVVNCVGILFERKRSTFHAAHVELPRQIATSCKRQNVDRLIHISALGIDQSQSRYGRSKLQGEQAVREAYPGVTILRPSVIFGPGDGFFNLFATLMQYLPALPLIGGGQTRFQPVYVEDVAAAAMVAVTGPDQVRGQTYELGGPEVLTFKEVYKRLFAEIGQSRMLVPLPWRLAKFKAWFWERLPGKLLTVDQVVSLQTDNIVQQGTMTWGELGLTPTSLSVVLPTYLDRFKVGGKFAERKSA